MFWAVSGWLQPALPACPCDPQVAAAGPPARCHTVIFRNISVTVSYADTDLCEDTWVEVADVEQCGCVCSSTPCQGLAERDEETGCVCTCHVSNTTQCGDQRHLSPHLCECQCDAREDNTPCWWKHDWSEQSCSCALQLTR